MLSRIVSLRPQLLRAVGNVRFCVASASQVVDDEECSAASFREKHGITLKGKFDEEFEPLATFDKTPYNSAIQRVFANEGFTAPTPIQAQSWPIALAGRDMISVARTGSGKTCGFLLPGITKILEEREQQRGTRRPLGEPTLLVLAPTRELAQQIHAEARKYAAVCRLTVGCFYGGSSKFNQIKDLRRAPLDIAIATPGRCNDLIESQILTVSKVNYLVLDEADRMLDMGFEPQIRSIINDCSKERQNLFFTATWPKEVQHLAMEYLNDPIHVNIGDTDSLNANKNIQQNIHVISPLQKQDKLAELLLKLSDNRPENVPKTIIFASRKGDCDELMYTLRMQGYKTASIHGDKTQANREQTLESFRRSQTRVLVATDVASRGLDIKDVDCVINYDFPAGKSAGVESYVHRIGRTGRAERTGISHTFFTLQDAACANELVDILTRSQQEVPDALRAMTTKARSGNKPSRTPYRAQSTGRYGGMQKFDLANDSRYSAPRQNKSYGEGGRDVYGGGYSRRDNYSPRDNYGSRSNYTPRDNYASRGSSRDFSPRYGGDRHGSDSFKDSSRYDFEERQESRPRKSASFDVDDFKF